LGPDRKNKTKVLFQEDRMLSKLRNNKGFTLVEVIVVAVIVAVLALVAIQLYQGYVREARRNTAENLAASAAGHLQAVYNSVGSSDWSQGYTDNLDATLESGQIVYFRVPANSTVTVTGTSVSATVKDISSIGKYDYR
jgi:prepilin-type N-terminal cleavage/methylation domain-containing protein